MSFITRVLSTMSRFGMRSLYRLFFHFFWFNLSALRLVSPPGGMRLPPEGEPCTTYQYDLKKEKNMRENLLAAQMSEHKTILLIIRMYQH